MTAWDTEVICPTGPSIAGGSGKAQGSKAKLAKRLRADQSEGRSDTKGGQQLAHPVPHRRDPTFSSFISGSRSAGFLHAPPCGLAPSHPGFPTRDYPGKTCETTWYGFDLGALAPVWSYGEALALAGSHP
jgi:hypothetical protein